MIRPSIRSRAPVRAFVIALAGLALAACQSASLSSSGLLPYAGYSMPSVTTAPAERRAASELVMDYSSGRILYEDRADGVRYPASLTKMMTLYLLFEAIEDGYISPGTPLRVSERAASREPSKLGLEAGSTIRAGDAAQAIAVKSANDVATVIAENLAGSEEAFAAAMTAKARSLGLNQTRFVNASGLPDPRQVTTARDMAKLGRALLSRHPRYARLFSVESFEYDGRTYNATNKLLGKVQGVDGLKTGYIRDAGSHLVATVKRGGRRLIIVVLGGQSSRARNARVTALIDRYLGTRGLPALAGSRSAGLAR